MIEVIAAGVTLLKAVKAIKAPIEQRAAPTTTRGMKKADREVEFVFIDFVPFALVGSMDACSSHRGVTFRVTL